MSFDDLEALNLTEPEPGLSREEDEEMFRARAQQLGRFAHSAILAQGRIAIPEALGPKGTTKSSKGTTKSSTKTPKLSKTRSAAATDASVSDVVKPQKTRKKRDTSQKSSKKTKTVRRRRVPLDQVPDTVMPATRAVNLAQGIKLVGPRVSISEAQLCGSDSRGCKGAIKELLKLRDSRKGQGTDGAGMNSSASLLSGMESMPSDLELEEALQLHDVSYQSRDLNSDTDNDSLNDNEFFGNSTFSNTGSERASCQRPGDDDQFPSTTSREVGAMAEARGHDFGDTSLEITNVRSIPEVVYVSEGTCAEELSEPDSTAHDRLNGFCVAAAEQDDYPSPPPTLNYNNYKSFMTVTESNVVYVSDSDCDYEKQADEAQVGSSPVGEIDGEATTPGTGCLVETRSAQTPGSPIDESNPPSNYNCSRSSGVTPRHHVKASSKLRSRNLGEDGAPIYRMVNTKTGPTHIYRMYSSDSDDYDSWTPEKFHDRRKPDKCESPQSVVALTSSPLVGVDSLPTHALSNAQDVASSEDTSIMSVRVDNGKCIYGPGPYAQSRFFHSSRMGADATAGTTEFVQKKAKLNRCEIDLTQPQFETDGSSEMECVIPETPELVSTPPPNNPGAINLEKRYTSTSHEGSAKECDDNVTGKECVSSNMDEFHLEAAVETSLPTIQPHPRSTDLVAKRAEPIDLSPSPPKRKRKQVQIGGKARVDPPASTQATASIAGQMIEKGEIDKRKMSELTEFIMSAPEARHMWLKMLTYQPIPLSQLMEFNKEHGIKISKVLTIAWCDLHGVTWTSRDEEKEITKEDDSDG